MCFFFLQTSSYYPVTTDNYFDHTQSKPTSHYSSYQTTNNDYSDDDDDLDALRTAALKTLNSKKRKVCSFFLLFNFIGKD